ncbi:MAG: C45 family peptidase, partial [Thermoguttaceae bacterium]|nr:C45 family peptidase [Thermoguttaceae bacterium]
MRKRTKSPALFTCGLVGFLFATILTAAPAVFSGEPTPLVAEHPPIELLAQDPSGAGILARTQGKRVLILAGSPEEMGRAHGVLLASEIKRLTERVLYVAGAVDSVRSGKWFFDVLAEIERRTKPFIPERFLRECDAMSEAAGLSPREGRFANLFPERFHCSGVAVRGKATRDGRVLHARVLDYMTDIGLQECAVVIVFIPQGFNTWLSVSYAGFLGTVTAMNEKGLAIGEIGGGGVGDWDGMPMSFLLRHAMESCSNVEEALELLRNTPRTCEYYYVLSDRSGNLAAVHADSKR